MHVAMITASDVTPLVQVNQCVRVAFVWLPTNKDDDRRRAADVVRVEGRDTGSEVVCASLI